MNDQRVGAAFRAVRLRRGLRQIDLAALAGVSAAVVSALEQGRIGRITVDAIRAVARPLDMQVDVVTSWHGPELDEILNQRRE